MSKPDQPDDRVAPVVRLEQLARQVKDATEPTTLVSLATELDAFGRTVAQELAIRRDDPDLRRVLVYVPTLQSQALLRAAEGFDDRGSPRRAVYVLFEALRTAFDASVITTISEALTLMLEANGQPSASATLRELLAAREQHRAEGGKVGEVRARFSESVRQLRDSVDWGALADPGEQFD
ncbi:MAG: hypothetical protein JWP01_3886 [Myxococcales bacterium]|nr:hypothetical protein [Myxococcales bacterium]